MVRPRAAAGRLVNAVGLAYGEMGSVLRRVNGAAMELRSILRILIVTEIVLVGVGIAVELLAERFLPDPLRRWLEEQMEKPFDAGDIVMILAVPLLGGLIVSWIGLWRLWGPARWIYLFTFCGGMLIEALGGPWIYSGPGAALSTLLSANNGVVLALVFLTPLATAFRLPRAAPPGGFEVDMTGQTPRAG